MDVGHRTNEAKAEAKVMADLGKKRSFNRAKIWQIGFFASNLSLIHI